MTEINSKNLEKLIEQYVKPKQLSFENLQKISELVEMCEQYIQQLEKKVQHYRSQKRAGHPVCLAVNDNGEKCDEWAKFKARYHGDPKHYSKKILLPSVTANLCKNHIGSLKGELLENRAKEAD
ncbi:MAG: hypothetical protein WAO91_01830 [Candidatus Nitrosotenuis sp.]